MRRILIVDQKKENIDELSKYISSDGHIIQGANDSETTLHRLKAWKPHIIFLDINVVKDQGPGLISKIRVLTQDDYTALVVTYTGTTLEDISVGMETGVDDYLSKPFQALDSILKLKSMLRLKEVQDSLRRANHRIDELSSTDDLTGVLNMRYAYRKGEEEITRLKRFRKPVSAILLNLDEFSTVNQNYGFLAGSHVLQEAAIRIKSCIRSIDLVARVGADEFFILLNDTDLASAEFIAERIRDAIQSGPFKSEKHLIKITATLGVAGIAPDQTSQQMSDLLHIAAEALRSAKANGTNGIEVYSFT